MISCDSALVLRRIYILLLKEADWKKLYRIVQKQALLGKQYGRMYMENIDISGERFPLPIFIKLLFGDGA